MLTTKPIFWRRYRHRWYSSQTTSNRKRKIQELLLLLLVVAIANTIAMVFLEGLPIRDAAWLTMTTMTTVGYGDISAETDLGRLATVLLMYLFGIFLLAQIVGEWIDYRISQKERMRKGLWRWKMEDHIVIVNTPESYGARYLRILVEQIRSTPKLTDYPIEVLSADFTEGLPAEISAMGVVLHHGRPEGRASLAEVDIQLASYIILLAVDTSDYRSDSLTLDVLDQLKSFDIQGHVVAECVLESNRVRLKRNGADAVIRPVRAYPELMVRAMAAPGTEEILEDLFKHEGNHTRRYDIEFEGKSWGEMACNILLQGLGTPMGYLDIEKQIVTNPAPEKLVSGTAIFVIANQNSVPDAEKIAACIA